MTVKKVYNYVKVYLNSKQMRTERPPKVPCGERVCPFGGLARSVRGLAKPVDIVHGSRAVRPEAVRTFSE